MSRRWAPVLALLPASAALLAACSTPPPRGDAVKPVSVTAAPAQLASAPSSADSRILQLARSFVFRVRNEACDVIGTAFSADATMVTNRHIAAGATSLDLATWDGSDFTGTVSVHADHQDLALVDAIPPGYAFATLAASDPPVGTPVWVAGYPLGDQLTVTDGKVTGTEAGAPFGLSGNLLDISNHVEHGNSGSPLLDANGDVVGVVFAMKVANHQGLAIPVSGLEKFQTGGAGDPSPIPCAM